MLEYRSSLENNLRRDFVNLSKFNDFIRVGGCRKMLDTSLRKSANLTNPF